MECFVACAGDNLLCIPKHRNVRIVRCENELGLGLQLPHQLYHVFIDRLIIEIVFWLIDNHHIAIPLTENKQDQR